MHCSQNNILNKTAVRFHSHVLTFCMSQVVQLYEYCVIHFV